MTVIKAPIVAWIEDYQPGIVECRLTDVAGREWSLIDKLPVVSRDDNLNVESEYPQPGVIACEILEERVDSQGRETYLVDTETPWGIESVEGNTQFEVFREQIELDHQ